MTIYVKVATITQLIIVRLTNTNDDNYWLCSVWVFLKQCDRLSGTESTFLSHVELCGFSPSTRRSHSPKTLARVNWWFYTCFILWGLLVLISNCIVKQISLFFCLNSYSIGCSDRMESQTWEAQERLITFNLKASGSWCSRKIILINAQWIVATIVPCNLDQ